MAAADRKSRILSRREIEAQIANGRLIVIVDNKVLKVDAWLHYHPGGDKAIRHMVGRDATDEVTRYVWQLVSIIELTFMSQVPFCADARAHEPLPDWPYPRAMDKLSAPDPGREVQDARRTKQTIKGGIHGLMLLFRARDC
jgi:hypothetical protein